MIDKLVVGKHTLESLTKGMYSDAKVIFREYIQNSVDAIKEARRLGVIDEEKAKINIKIDNSQSEIIIKDNGTGIEENKVKKVLLDIGNSSKNPKSANGFRGIGRLSGLGYCDKLIFTTSFKGENIETKIIFNAHKLNKLLIPGEYKDHSLLDVIKQVTSFEKSKAKKDAHYFKVDLKNVKNYDHILDFDNVKKYLSQTAPVYFDKNNFNNSKKIRQVFKEKNLALDEFNIILSSGVKKENILKPFSDNFISDRRKKIKDNVKKINTEIIRDENDKIIALLWYSISNFFGTIFDNSKKGIRLRKGNFQIGDRFILNKIFKEDRFNGWFQGEVYVFNDNIIPNARRDDFETNSDYEYLLAKLKTIGDKLSNRIRSESKKRSKLKKEQIIFDKIDILNGIKENDINNKIIELADNIPDKEKKVLDKVFNIIDKEYGGQEKGAIIKKIITNY